MIAQPGQSARVQSQWVRALLVSGGAVLVLLLLTRVALQWGTPSLSAATLHAVLTGGEAERLATVVVWELRMPRVLLGTLAGAMLALAGVLLQDGLRNDLAGPELLGVSAGASVVVALLVVGRLPVGWALFPWLALGGALMAGGVVWWGARSLTHPTHLILVGAALSALLNALLVALLSLGTQSEVGMLYLFLVGSLANRTWQHVGLLLPWAMGGVVLALACARPLNLLRLGDDIAEGLGLAVAPTRLRLLALSAALVAGVVAVCGPVGWIALLAPHLTRRLIGTSDARWVLPLAALVGAALLVGADLVARLAFAPAESPVGLWTTLAGGPILLVLLQRLWRAR